MVEGKTDNDPKMTASKEVSPHLYEDGTGHLRRVWNEIETKFINFIAQKVKNNEPGA